MAVKKISKREQKRLEESLNRSYNKFKEFEGKKYTGMKIGRSHKWNYDQGVWKETKRTPDEWEITYSVTKRRAGKAPEGSGVPVGTEYQWYIMAHQNVKKLDANNYSTALTGIKYKLAHKRADSEKWNVSDKAQRKRLIKFLEEMAARLKEQEKTAVNTVKKLTTGMNARTKGIKAKDRLRKQAGQRTFAVNGKAVSGLPALKSGTIKRKRETKSPL